MPRQASISIENDFSRGLITEFSAISFPESAATEIWDCVISLNKKTRRRLGFDFELNFATATVDRDNSVVQSYLWKNVLGDGDLSLLVLQVGETLYFYKTTQPISATVNILSSTIDLTTFQSGSTSPALTACHFSNGNGLLFVTHSGLDAFYVEYDADLETVAATEITPEIRDFAGLEEVPDLDVDERPTATIAQLSTTHHYNLFNQGWYFDDNQALSDWDTARSDMPSNADAWWYYKDSSGDWDNAQVARFNPGNTPASKGHYILNVFEEDRSDVSGIEDINVVSTDNERFSTSAFFAGRKFFSGIDYKGKENSVYFSQIVENNRQYGYCYQRNDPATEDFFDLLSSDGGVIQIPDAGNVVKLFVLQHILLVFTTTGIWSISGSEGLGFTANDYVVTKISDVGALSSKSFVSVEGAPMWWNEDGIYILTIEGTQNYSVQNLAQETIKSFYEDIPPSAKRNAKGAYNKNSRIVQWLYQSEDPGSVEEIQEYDRILNFNVQLGAFYPWTISSSDVKVHDIFVVEGTGGDVSVDNVIDEDGDNVVNEDGDNVVVLSQTSSVVAPVFKYVVSYPEDDSYEFTFAETRGLDYLDWVSFEDTGVDYESYLITGYKIRGDAMRYQQSNYIMVYFDLEENASCLVQGLWDWAGNSDSGKFSSTQQAYTTRRNNFDIVMRRLKLRGKGRALQVKFSSETGMPFTLLGWAAFDTVNEML